MPTETDLISTLLRSMQVAASLLLNERYAPPWAVDLPDSAGLVDVFGLPAGTHVVAFHLVREGAIQVRSVDGEHTVRAGEVIILYRGGAHRMWCGAETPSISLQALLATRPAPEAAGRGDSGHHADRLTEPPPVADRRPDAPADTRLICGAFTLRNTRLNPLFDALPPTAVLSFNHGSSKHWLSSVARQLVAELEHPAPGSAFVVDRLLELFCAASVRECMTQHHNGARNAPPGWFRALRDDAALKALLAIHDNPAFAWTVDTLAARASLSRSRLTERFTNAVGEAPMQYVTKWRMNTATRLLKESRSSVEQVANDVGYASPAAFSRAFKQHLGVSPARFRTDDRHWI